MAMVIIEDCINCGACAVECPTEAIYEPGESWKENGRSLAPLSNEHFYIATDICDECSGLKQIKCIVICPMDAIEKIK